jgi:hypothetical protein
VSAWEAVGASVARLRSRTSVRLDGRRIALAGIVLVGYGFSLHANWPGHFEPDSLWQLAQGKAGVYNDWHPPVMAWLLGLAAHFDGNAPLFIVFDGALYFGAIASFGLLAPRPGKRLFLALSLILISPLSLIYQGVVWKDVLFADAAVAGFAAVAWAGRAWEHRRTRFALIAAAFALFSLASLVRQNGLVVPICGAGGLAGIAYVREIGAPGAATAPKRAGIYGGAALAITLALVALGGLALNTRSDGQPENLHQVRRLQVYDLAGMARQDPRLDLAILHRDDPDLKHFIRVEAAPHWTAAGADNLENLAHGGELIPANGAVSRQWSWLVVHRLDLYLRTRTASFLSTLLTPARDQCPTVFVGVDGEEPDLLKQSGLAARYTPQDQWDETYAMALQGAPVFSHLLYAAILLVLSALALSDLLRGDRRPEHVVVLAMASAAVLFAGSFFIISNACDYRYLYFLDVAAMAAVVIRAAGLARTQPDKGA